MGELLMFPERSQDLRDTGKSRLLADKAFHLMTIDNAEAAIEQIDRELEKL